MPLSIKTLGCNGLCRSCYENRIRSVFLDTSYDIKAILATIEKETVGIPENQRYTNVCLHGGEPLMMKFEDLEKLLDKIHSLYGHTSIQTNGVLISDEIIELFKKYKTSVGVSIDGDTAELNYGRWNGGDLTKEQIQRMTDKVLYNMKKCKDAGLSLSVIALLRKYNASQERLGGFIRFLLRLKDEFGISSVRINECIVYEEEYRREEELTNKEMGEVLCKLADVCLSSSEINWLPYRDIVDMLMGYRDATCVFTECDVWRTSSERTIMADGSIGCCLKGGAALDGIQALAGDKVGRERYVILRQVSQDLKGCKGCRFWFMCKGGCPGEAVDNDWRNRTRFCEAWKTLFSHIEDKIRGLFPNVYTLPMFYPARPTPSQVQYALGNEGSTWKCGKRRDIGKMREECRETVDTEDIRGDGYGDRPHGDSGHGDRPHGDSSHGDSPGYEKKEDHGDAPHGDGYGDSGHGDATHGDAPHGDRPHGDG